MEKMLLYKNVKKRLNQASSRNKNVVRSLVTETKVDIIIRRFFVWYMVHFIARSITIITQQYDFILNCESIKIRDSTRTNSDKNNRAVRFESITKILAGK